MAVAQTYGRHCVTSNTFSPSSHNGRSHGNTTLTTSTAVMGRQVSPDASLLHTQPLRTPSTASSTSLACHRDRLETLHRADAPHCSRSAHDSRVVADGVGPKPCDQGAEEHEMAKKMPVAVATFSIQVWGAWHADAGNLLTSVLLARLAGSWLDASLGARRPFGDLRIPTGSCCDAGFDGRHANSTTYRVARAVFALRPCALSENV